MALRRFFNEIRGKKLNEVPEHVKPMLSLGYIRRAIQRGMDNYHANAATLSTASSTLSSTTDSFLQEEPGY
ncbi:hypothetical protein VNO80_14898 [Phaseolus coccineus]|uniref:Uncharacterized protein n=1 Tax=Phaseolus coccineus TaxID=3886 RepID=A0AAN9R6G7_PHACN